MPKPENQWTRFRVTDVPPATNQCDDVYIGYEKGWRDAQMKLLEYLIKESREVASFNTVGLKFLALMESMLAQLREN